ncbi:MAG: hypothetical protein ABL999_10960 [Pyrinomonadaceae bacterium]
MRKRLSRIFPLAAILAAAFFTSDSNVSLAQPPLGDGIYMFGRIDNDKAKSGIFVRNRQDLKNRDWCVFIGENGSVYKMSLIDRSVHELFIDGKRVDDSLIWKRTAEFKPYLEKYWRDRELEKESADLERQMKPIEIKIEAVSKEMEKLDKFEQRLERSAAGFADDRKSLSDARRRIADTERGFSHELEGFARQQDRIGREQESLNLMEDLDKVLKQICTDLQALGVIKNTANLSFKLSNVELVVNGKRVSPEVLDLLKARYIIAEDGESGFLYRWKGEI